MSNDILGVCMAFQDGIGGTLYVMKTKADVSPWLRILIKSETELLTKPASDLSRVDMILPGKCSDASYSRTYPESS
jgi:hypothetical protein